MEARNWSAVGPTFHIALFYNHNALTCQNVVEFNNNATVCYSCIDPNLANLILQRANLNFLNAQIHGHILSNTKYHIKTALGFSDGHYQHLE